MAALDFPSSPVNGQQYSLNGVNYYYDAAVGAWVTSFQQTTFDTLFAVTNSAFTQSNSAYAQSNNAYVAANSAISAAANAINSIASVVITNGTLTDGATISWNLSQYQIATVTLGGDRTLANASNLSVGTYILHIYQDATGSRTLSYGTGYKWPLGVSPPLSTTASAHDVLSFVCDGTNMYGSYMLDVK
jgi:hypothetical protein